MNIIQRFSYDDELGMFRLTIFPLLPGTRVHVVTSLRSLLQVFPFQKLDILLIITSKQDLVARTGFPSRREDIT